MSCCLYSETHGVHAYNCDTVTKNVCPCGARRSRPHRVPPSHNIGCGEYVAPCDPLNKKQTEKKRSRYRFVHTYQKLQGKYDNHGLKLATICRKIVEWEDFRDAKLQTNEWPALQRGGALRIGKYVFFAPLNEERVFYEPYKNVDDNHMDLEDKAAIGDWVSLSSNKHKK
jgi:hypothetical protein